MEYLHSKTFETPLGEMVAVACDEGVCLLEFTDKKGLDKEFAEIEKLFGLKIIPGESPNFDLLQKELSEYFEGKLMQFKVPVSMVGTDFQKKVWDILRKIPYGKTQSYLQQSEVLGNVKAVRAVASANGKNKICIVIPCHRVIGSNGTLTGYSGGIERKKKLLELEKATLF